MSWTAVGYDGGWCDGRVQPTESDLSLVDNC